MSGGSAFHAKNMMDMDFMEFIGRSNLKPGAAGRMRYSVELDRGITEVPEQKTPVRVVEHWVGRCQFWHWHLFRLALYVQHVRSIHLVLHFAYPSPTWLLPSSLTCLSLSYALTACHHRRFVGLHRIPRPCPTSSHGRTRGTPRVMWSTRRRTPKLKKRPKSSKKKRRTGPLM